MTTWVLIVALGFAFPGYKTKDDCIAALKQAENATNSFGTPIMICVPHPDGFPIIGASKGSN